MLIIDKDNLTAVIKFLYVIGCSQYIANIVKSMTFEINKLRT
jgi:hypothetical protein